MNDLITFTAMLDEVKVKRYPSTVTLSTADKTVMAGYIEDAVKEALEAAFWPKLTLSEQRTPVSGLIAWAQADETKMGMVEGVYRTDPTLGSAIRVPHRIVPDGVQVAASYGTAWVRFMEPIPQLAAEEYAAATAYIAGSVRVDPADGNCYLALLASTGSTPNENPTDWKIQPIPLFLKKYIRFHARHEMLSEEDGKWTALRDADRELDRLCIAEFEHQGQNAVSDVRC